MFRQGNGTTINGGPNEKLQKLKITTTVTKLTDQEEMLKGGGGRKVLLIKRSNVSNVLSLGRKASTLTVKLLKMDAPQ